MDVTRVGMAPELKTARLRLRSWSERDADDAFEIYREPEVSRFLGDGAPMPSLDVARIKLAAWIKKYSRPEMLKWGCWALELTKTGRVVGMGLLTPTPGPDAAVEIGWHLGRAHWGQGLVTEAGWAMLRYGFEDCKLDDIIALIDPANERSAGVAKRLAMRLVDRTIRFNGHDCNVWSLSRSEWLQIRGGE